MTSVFQLPPRLRSTAKYSQFNPSALATSQAHSQSISSSPLTSSNSIAAISSKNNAAIILFGLNQPFEPLLVYHSTHNQSQTSNLQFSLDSRMLAASYDSSVLVYDCTGEALQPLVTRISSGSTRKHICSLEWRSLDSHSNSCSGYGHELVTCTEDVIAQWDLRASKKPSSTYHGKDLVSVSCDQHEIASISSEGIVAIYDARKNFVMDSTGDSLYNYKAHEIGVGIEKLGSHWITWGVEDTDETNFKIWKKRDSVENSLGDNYWYVDNGTGKENADSMDNTSLECVIETKIDQLTTVKVLSQSGDQFHSQEEGHAENAFVTVSTPSLDANEKDAVSTLWQANLWALSPKATGMMGVENLAMFRGGGSSDAMLSQMVGKDYADGHLIAAELSCVPGNPANQDEDKKTEFEENECEALLCCLTSTGYLTTHAIPEADEWNAKNIGRKEYHARQKQSSPFRYHHIGIRALPDTSTKVYGEETEIDINAATTTIKARLGRKRGKSDADLYKGKSATIGDLGTVEGGIMQFDLDDEFNKDQNLPEQIVPNEENVLLVQQTKSISEVEEVDPVKAACVPSPRLCGAVFGADGTLASFHNGNVNKMWKWYTSDFQVQSPSHLQHKSAETEPNGGSMAFQDLEDEYSTLAEEDLSATNNNMKYPRSVWDLMKMNESAKVAQWGKERDDDDTNDSRQSSSASDDDSSDSGDSEVSSDSGSDESFLGSSARSMYETYFGKLHDVAPRFGGPKKEDSGRDNKLPTRTRGDSFVGPVTENLEPKVFVTGHLKELVMSGQCPELADHWILGPWTDDSKRQGSYLIQKNAESASIAEIDDQSGVPSRDEKRRNLMVGNLKKLYYQDNKKGSDLSTVPLDQKFMHKENTVRFPEEKTDTVRPLDTISASATMRPDLVDINYLQQRKEICYHNARISAELGQHGKAQVWRLIAEIIDNIAGTTFDDFDGWHSINGSAMGRDLILNILQFYEMNGDVQMLATIVSVLRSRKHDPLRLFDLLLPDNSHRYDLYIHFYSQILYSWGKLITRVELNKHLSENALNNESAVEKKFVLPRNREMFSPLCQLCNRDANPETNICHYCKQYAFRCSVCTNAVRGLFTVCISCGHGGHVNHIMPWFAEHSECPTGCGCMCNLTTVIHEEKAPPVRSNAGRRLSIIGSADE